MSVQSKACRALIDSMEIIESMAITDIMQKINTIGLDVDQATLEEVRASIKLAVDTAKNRGVDQVIKATS